MTVQSRVAYVEKREVTFPCLMRGTATGNIYLMSKPGTGTAVYLDATSNSKRKLGEHSENLAMDMLEIHNGSVTLTEGDVE